jgi:hypothetical protein
LLHITTITVSTRKLPVVTVLTTRETDEKGRGEAVLWGGTTAEQRERISLLLSSLFPNKAGACARIAGNTATKRYIIITGFAILNDVRVLHFIYITPVHNPVH